MKTILMLMALLVVGCGSGDRHYAAIAGADEETAFYVMAAIDAWNKTGATGLVYVAQADQADLVVSMGKLDGKRCGQTTWLSGYHPNKGDYSTSNKATITIDLESNPQCVNFAGSYVVAHELGHYMSGLRHLADPNALMSDNGNSEGHDLDHAITPADVDYLYGKGVIVD